MTTQIVSSGEVSDDFFAPAPSDLIDQLLAQYRGERARISNVAALFRGDMGEVVRYFIHGNGHKGSALGAERLFREEGALASLNAAFWSKVLAHTDVLDVMPQSRRNEWNEMITSNTTPEFSDNIVRPTIESLLNCRQGFLAERVEGIFHALSGEHVTNAPQGFSKRMILGNLLGFNNHVCRVQTGHINDLRCVIAKFRGLDEPKSYQSGRDLEYLREHWGEWFDFDGGALRIRLYKKGTAHLEVHPIFSRRLNSVLAYRYPFAIPEAFRAAPKNAGENLPLLHRPLSFAARGLLAERLPLENGRYVDLSFLHPEVSEEVISESVAALRALGGHSESPPGRVFVFDTPPRDALQRLLLSGVLA